MSDFVRLSLQVGLVFWGDVRASSDYALGFVGIGRDLLGMGLFPGENCGIPPEIVEALGDAD